MRSRPRMPTLCIWGPAAPDGHRPGGGEHQVRLECPGQRQPDVVSANSLWVRGRRGGCGSFFRGGGCLRRDFAWYTVAEHSPDFPDISAYPRADFAPSFNFISRVVTVDEAEEPSLAGNARRFHAAARTMVIRGLWKTLIDRLSFWTKKEKKKKERKSISESRRINNDCA